MADTPDILKKIVAQKWLEISERQLRRPLAQLETGIGTDTRGFAAAIHDRWRLKQTAVIAELKKASPSKGIIRENFDAASIARSYAQGGATCLSVLTDELFFMGCDEYLTIARAAIDLPVLRKDFIVDAYQVYEARYIGADCILLIVSILSVEKLRELHALANELDLDVLVEVHDEAELEMALQVSPDLLGINNRNLRTFETDLMTTVNLLKSVPASTPVITESGIHKKADIELMLENGVFGFLVGEAFMRAEEPGLELRGLFANLNG